MDRGPLRVLDVDRDIGAEGPAAVTVDARGLVDRFRPGDWGARDRGGSREGERDADAETGTLRTGSLGRLVAVLVRVSVSEEEPVSRSSWRSRSFSSIRSAIVGLTGSSTSSTLGAVADAFGTWCECSLRAVAESDTYPEGDLCRWRARADGAVERPCRTLLDRPMDGFRGSL